MKACTEDLFLLPALIAGFGMLLAGRVMAQTFTTLHSFRATSSGTNSDGAAPVCRFDFIGRHAVWGGAYWRQFGRWHGVQGQH
jgi:hypothetical protein